MARILLVEDDQELCIVTRDWLSHQGHVVDVVHTATDGEEYLKSYEYELVILDWTLPDGSGIELLRKLRGKGHSMPVLILTGKKEMHEKEEGFDSGADDYLTKPFDMKELSARLRAILRRPPNIVQEMLKAGDITLDPVTHKVTKAGAEIKLYRREFTLLEFLIRNKDQVFSPDALIDRLWAADKTVGPETIRTSIKRIREQLDEDGKPSLIENVRGVGYRVRG